MINFGKSDLFFEPMPNFYQPTSISNQSVAEQAKQNYSISALLNSEQKFIAMDQSRKSYCLITVNFNECYFFTRIPYSLLN